MLFGFDLFRHTLKGQFFIHGLASPLRRHDHQTRRLMSEPNTGIPLVPMLTAGTGVPNKFHATAGFERGTGGGILFHGLQRT